jgi:hypothetical protein
VEKGFRIHFGHSPHVNNDIECWIERLAREMGEIAVEMAYACR